MMTNVLFNLLKETFMALLGKIAFKAIFERLLTRLLIKSLKSLAAMTTNTIDDATVDDIIKSLQGKNLTVIDKYSNE